jgi:hypothetical protein
MSPSRAPCLVFFTACLLLACSDTPPPTESDASAAAGHDAPDAATHTGGNGQEGDAATRPRDASLPERSDAQVVAPPADAALPDAGTAPREPGQARSYTTDRTQFFGTPRCGLDTFLLCDDFEGAPAGGKANSALWSTMGERITVDATRAARGKQSLHVTTRSNENLHFIRTTKVVPAAKNKLWGRLFFWVATRPTKFSHWTTIEATGIHPKGGTARMRFGGIHVPNVENRLDFNYDIWGGRPDGFHEVGRELVGKNLPDGTWHCLEWLLDVPAREARLFRDGTEESGVASSKSIDGIALDFPIIDGLNIGMSIYQDIGSSSWDVWIDEVAVDVARIGCGT